MFMLFIIRALTSLNYLLSAEIYSMYCSRSKHIAMKKEKKKKNSSIFMDLLERKEDKKIIIKIYSIIDVWISK